MGAWLPDPLADQHLAGGILWGSGDLVGLVLLRGALRPVGAVVDAGGRARGPAARPARGARGTAPGERAARATGSIAAVSDSDQRSSQPLRVLVYSDDVNTRQQVILALGRRPHPDLPELEYVEVATEPVVIQNMDAGGIDLAILDGEAVPGRRHGHRQAAQGRDLPVPAGAGADRPARRTPGWPPGRAPRPPCRTRSTRSSSPRRSSALLRAARARPATLTAAPMTHLARGPRRRWSPRTDLTAEQTAWAMGEILAGEATPAQIAGFAVGAARQGRDRRGGHRPGRGDVRRATPLDDPRPAARRRRHRRRPLDGVNISTMAAIVAAGAGARVVKHGNRSASSQSGLGRRARGARHPARPAARPGRRGGRARPASPSASRRPSTRRCGTPRCRARELGIATTFNFLGPLANPARPAAQAIGCADPRMAPVMAGVFAAARRRRLGLPRRRRPRRADHDHHLVGVASCTTARSPTDDGRPGRPRHRAGARTEDLRGGDAAHNAEVVRRLLDGETGPVRDAVLLNAGAALAVYDAPGGAGRGGAGGRHSPGPPRRSTPAPPADARRAGSPRQPAEPDSGHRSPDPAPVPEQLEVVGPCTTVQPSLRGSA